MVGVSASVNLPLHHTSISSLLALVHPGGPRKRLPDNEPTEYVEHIFSRLDALPVTQLTASKQRQGKSEKIKMFTL